MVETIRQLNLLVVEDDEALGRAVKRRLSEHWKSVRVAHTVQQGLAEIATQQYDVVLSDWDVPVGGGRLMVERCTLPLVIHTGGWIERLAQHVNGTPIVQKPATVSELNIALYQAYKKSCL